ncbi:MAG: transposase [Pseudomonadota bacterium]
MLKTRSKWLSTLSIGILRAKESIKNCPRDGTVCRSEQLRSLSPVRSSFGFDVLVWVGEAFFRRQRSVAETVMELHSRNVFLSSREVGYLGRRFIVYLALAHRAGLDRLNMVMRRRGGYILHIDGTCEGDSPMLFTGMDELLPVVLDNVKIPSEQAELLIPFLTGIRQRHGVPAALVHDMGRGILAAVAEVFPEVPDFICHYHFLRDIGKDLLEDDYQTVRALLQKHKARALLRQKLKSLRQAAEENSQAPREPKRSETEESAEQVCLALIQWILDFPIELAGYGFPFDRPHLALYHRLKTACGLMGAAARRRLASSSVLSTIPRNLSRLLKSIIEDRALSETVRRLEDKAAVFDRLRRALDIAMPDGENGLNDDGGAAELKTVARRVNEFRQWLQSTKDLAKEKGFHKMLEQIDKYWDKLFADPIRAETPDGPVWLQPQRTNNIMERFFRDLKRDSRRRTGTSSLTKTLRAILADTPLVKNLDNPEYMKILLDESSTLEQRFARIDGTEAQKEMRRASSGTERMPPALKKLIRRPDFTQHVKRAFSARAN